VPASAGRNKAALDCRPDSLRAIIAGEQS
jgi:hypothetical protein